MEVLPGLPQDLKHEVMVHVNPSEWQHWKEYISDFGTLVRMSGKSALELLEMGILEDNTFLVSHVLTHCQVDINSRSQSLTKDKWVSLCIYTYRKNYSLPCIELLTLLQAAIALDRREVAEILLAHPDIDPSLDSQLAFLWAVFKDNVRIVKLLLQNPAVDPTVFDNRAIKTAVGCGKLDMVRLLLQDERVSPDHGNYSSLYDALYHYHPHIKSQYMDIMRVLLADKRIDPNYGNGMCLTIAVANNYLEIVPLLLQHERIRTSTTFVSLIAAIYHGHTETVRLLIEYGRIDSRINNDEGIKQIIKQSMVTFGVSPAHSYDDSTTDDNILLRFARQKGNKEIISLLEDWEQ